jgi:hypothetical protein
MNGKAILNSLQKSGRGRTKEIKVVAITDSTTHATSCSNGEIGGVSIPGGGVGN